MSAPSQAPATASRGFRLKLLLAMMFVVAAITALGLYFEERNLARDAAANLQQQFQSELASLHNLQEARHTALAERCRALVRKPRIHAALEDNALDLLYPSARDELREIMSEPVRGEFYRFLNANGAVIPAEGSRDAGDLTPDEERRLALNNVPRAVQAGYIARADTILEVITMPIVSTETGEVIAALAIGFRPVAVGGKHPRVEMTSGIWLNGRLHFSSLNDAARQLVETKVDDAVRAKRFSDESIRISLNGVANLLFYKPLNSDSQYPLACEVCLFPLTDLEARQRQARWQILLAGAFMLLAGFVASHFISTRLSKPVQKLADERERAARFSADASHQLKTPVAVIRAGLEELQARDTLAPDVHEEISQLIHQTYRLQSVIDDLLLLSRMDAGRLQLAFGPVDFSQLVEAEVDDLTVADLSVESDIAPGLCIVGEKRYTSMIVHNLLENARKYNQPGGAIRVKARQEGGAIFLTIGNMGRGIPAPAREHIFERFHRGAAGENIPGHGLGLNLARELARLHGGDVRLIRSEENWTEFEIRFRAFEGRS